MNTGTSFTCSLLQRTRWICRPEKGSQLLWCALPKPGIYLLEPSWSNLFATQSTNGSTAIAICPVGEAVRMRFAGNLRDASVDIDIPAHFSNMFFGRWNMPQEAFGQLMPGPWMI